MIVRAYDAVVDAVNKADCTLVAKINTAAVDRYHTVIDPRGAKLDNYRKNPAVLWEHGKDPRRFTDPIGRNLWVRHGGGQRPDTLLARTKFLEDDFSRQRFEWYRDGTLNAFSVNILPVAERCGPPTREEMRALPEWEAAETIYREWDLAEYSGTTIPGNASCLAERAAKMLDLVSRNLLWLPDEVLPIVEEAARTMTESVGGQAAGGELAEDDGDCPECGAKCVRGAMACPNGHRLDAGRTSTGQPPVVSKALELLEGAVCRSIVDIAREAATERRADQQALRDFVAMTIDLHVYGRV